MIREGAVVIDVGTNRVDAPDTEKGFRVVGDVAYDEMLGKAAAGDASLHDLEIRTVTMLNSKTQPQLLLGRNTVYVGLGEQTDSVAAYTRNDRTHQHQHRIRADNAAQGRLKQKQDECHEQTTQDCRPEHSS